MMGKLTRKLVSAGLSLFLVLGSVSLTAQATASPSDFSAADVYSAKLLAKVSKQRVLVESLLTEDSTTWVNQDGTFTTDTSSSPIRVSDENSSSGWRDLDFTLVVKSDGTVGPTSPLFPLKLSNGGSQEQVNVSGVVQATGEDGTVIGFGWNGQLPTPTLFENKATYADVLPGVDLVIEANVYGFEQFFILEGKPSLETLQALAIPLKMRKVKLIDLGDGTYSFNNSANEVIANIPQPRVWDSSIEPISGLPIDETFDLNYLADAKTLQLDGLEAYFENQNLVYPVTIDPSVSLTTNGDTYVLSDTGLGYGTASELLLGTYNGGSTKARAFVRFNSSSWVNKEITKATFTLYEHWSYSCNARNVTIYPAAGNLTSSTNWANQPLVADSSVKTTVSTAKGYSSSCAANYVAFEAKAVVQYLADHPNSGSNFSTIALRASESDSYGWKRFHSGSGAHPPTLSVTYNNPPKSPVMTQIIPGQIVDGVPIATALTPTFSALVSDIDNDKLTVAFYSYPDATSTLNGTKLCQITGVASGGTASCKSSVAFADNNSFYVRAQSSDATSNSPFSSPFLFRTAGSQPISPGLSCADFSNGSKNDSPAPSAISCTLTQYTSAGISDATKVLLTIDSGDAISLPTIDGTLNYSFTLPSGAAAHLIEATSYSAAGLASNESVYSFSSGKAGIYWPKETVLTGGVAKLSAYLGMSSVGYSGTKLKWYTDDSSTAHIIDLNSSALQNYKGLQGLFNYQWNTRELFKDQAFRDYIEDGVAHISVEVCFSFIAPNEVCTADKASLMVTGHAFTSANPTSNAGQGTVSLLSGELLLNTADVNQAIPEGSLSVSRSYLSYGLALSSQSFGPGWQPNFAGFGGGGSSYKVVDATLKQATITLIDAAGGSLNFKTPNGIMASDPEGAYQPVSQDTKGSFTTLSMDSFQGVKRLRLTEAENRVTTWTLSNSKWLLQNVVEADGRTTNTYSYDSSQRLTRILGPIPVGVSCPLGSETAGCRMLLIDYAQGAAATSTVPGSKANQVSSISFKAFDPTTNQMKTTTVAKYLYNLEGYLVDATDPRTGISTTYTYLSSAAGFNKLIDTVKTDGFAAYHYKYSSTGELLNVTRDKADGTAGFDIENTFVYNTPISGSNLPDLSTSNTSTWGQNTSPLYCTVVFGADQTFANPNLNTQIVLSNLTATQIRSGDFVYADANGRVINTSSFGLTKWLYTSTQRDTQGRPTTVFSANAIYELLELKAAGNLDGIDVTTFATVNKYKPNLYDATNKLLDGGQLLETWTPTRQMNINGEIGAHRLHTVVNYDEGAPAQKLAGNVAYGLETSRTTTIANSTGLNEAVISKTVTSYDPIDQSSPTGATSGWIIREATNTRILDPSTGSVIAQNQYLFDALGNKVKTIPNGSTGSDALSDTVTYYTAASNPTIADCGGKPQWAGLVCFVGSPNGAPRETPNKQIVGYDYYLKPLVTKEIFANGAGSSARTVALTYYEETPTPNASAGKVKSATVAVTGVLDTTVEPTINTYDATTGLLLSTAKVSNPTEQYVSYTYDLWGRRTSTKSSNKIDTTQITDQGFLTYVPYGQIGAGNIKTDSNAKSTLTYSYGGTTTAGIQELRGLPTNLTVSGIGTYTAEYNETGQIVLQSAPGTINQQFDYNSAGELTRMAYSSIVTTPTTPPVTERMEWFDNTRTYDEFGRVKTETTPGANPQTDGSIDQTFAYDPLGRLTTVQEVADDACTSRNYTFDNRGNRTNKVTSSSSATGAVCDTTTNQIQQNLNYSIASKITNIGYVYDALGRNTSIPATDVPNGQSLAIAFGSDNRIVSQTQGTKSYLYAFDVLGRRLTETTKTGTTINSVTTRHYINDSDNPAWVTTASQTDIFSPSLGSSLNAVTTINGSTTTKTIQIANLHGDTLTSITLPATGAVTPPSDLNLYDEYGLQTNLANPNPQDQFLLGYGSLGQAQRQTTDTGITLMGVRGYNPVTGQFLSPDPIQGGNETTYNYPNDPINSRDITGQFDEIGEAISDIVFGGLALYASLELCAGMFICAIGLSGVAGFLSGALNAATNGASFEMIINAGMRKSADFQAAALITGGIGIGVRKLIQTGKTRLTLSEEIKLDVSIEVGSTVRENALKFGRPGPKTSKQFGGTLATRGWSAV